MRDILEVTSEDFIVYIPWDISDDKYSKGQVLPSMYGGFPTSFLKINPD